MLCGAALQAITRDGTCDGQSDFCSLGSVLSKFNNVQLNCAHIKLI